MLSQHTYCLFRCAKLFDFFRAAVAEIYNTNYGPALNTYEGGDSDYDEFTAHVFKRPRREDWDELEAYLKAPTTDGKTDVLEWWKVGF